ncbi:MAG: hypothetical protein ABJG15_10855 [Hyphomonadaceae bacterium]
MAKREKTVAQKMVETMDGGEASFQEKMAIVSLFAYALASLFFSGVLWQVDKQNGSWEGAGVLGLLLGMAAIISTAHIGGAIWAAVTNIEDAKAAADERDWRIRARAGHARSIMMSGLLAIFVGSYFFGATAETLVKGMLVAFLAGGVVANGAKVYLYRSGL